MSWFCYGSVEGLVLHAFPTLSAGSAVVSFVSVNGTTTDCKRTSILMFSYVKVVFNVTSCVLAAVQSDNSLRQTLLGHVSDSHEGEYENDCLQGRWLRCVVSQVP